MNERCFFRISKRLQEFDQPNRHFGNRKFAQPFVFAPFSIDRRGQDHITAGPFQVDARCPGTGARLVPRADLGAGWGRKEKMQSAVFAGGLCREGGRNAAMRLGRCFQTGVGFRAVAIHHDDGAALQANIGAGAALEQLGDALGIGRGVQVAVCAFERHFGAAKRKYRPAAARIV